MLLDTSPRLDDYPAKPCEAQPWMSAGGFAVSDSANMRRGSGTTNRWKATICPFLGMHRQNRRRKVLVWPGDRTDFEAARIECPAKPARDAAFAGGVPTFENDERESMKEPYASSPRSICGATAIAAGLTAPPA